MKLNVGKNFQYTAVIFFICPSNHSPLTAPRLFVHVNSLASSSKVMWKFTNSPPAAFPLKSILCQKHKMSTGNFSPLLLDLEVCTCWQERWRVCLCVRDRKKKFNCVIYCLALRPPNGNTDRKLQLHQWLCLRPSVTLPVCFCTSSVNLVKLKQPWCVCVCPCVSLLHEDHCMIFTPPSG